MEVTRVEKISPGKFNKNANSYKGKDSRKGRLHPVKTDRGAFRFKDNKKDD